MDPFSNITQYIYAYIRAHLRYVNHDRNIKSIAYYEGYSESNLRLC
jgi:hypothetical protein